MTIENNNNDIVENITPAEGTVNADDLLNKIEQFISDHAILPKGGSSAIALWCLASYNINNFRIFPRLAVISPEKRCGKSTVLDLIEAFSYKPLITSNMTPASIFRIINSYQPTLIMDEADTFVAGGSNEIRGIINSGHAKAKAFVTRCSGESHDVVRYSTWTPMVLASIGDLPSTIMDRSIIIPIKRKAQDEKVKRIDVDLSDKSLIFRQKLLKWSLDNSTGIKNNPVTPSLGNGNDRGIDNWLPLFTIANQVSEVWLDKCKVAYGLLNTCDAEPELSTLLLADISEIFNNHTDTKIPSADLVTQLIKDQDKPWCEYKGGKPLTQNKLAGMLKTYGIKSKVIRYRDKTPRGYELDQFDDSFKRYI